MSRDITTQATNKVTIVGKLLNATFADGKLGDGRYYERANLTVRVEQLVNGVTETSEIPISVFASKYTQKGTPNPAFENLQRVKEMNTAQNVGIDAAETIRITSASLRENNYVTKSGTLVNGFQINASFINGGASSNEIATFNTDIVILDMYDEIDSEGDPTGRLIIRGGIVQYNAKLDVLEFIVEGNDQVDYVQRAWSVNDMVNVGGRIRITTKETVAPVSNNSWGEVLPDTPTTQFVRELIVTRGSEAPFDEDMAYDLADVQRIHKVRKAEIEQLQLNAKKPSAAAPTNKPANKYSWE